jgi:hypothetical protein
MGLSFAAFANTNPGDDPENKKTDLTGGVVHADTRKPVSNVAVAAYVSNKREKVVYTDRDGNFSFTDLKPGTYRLVFEKDGFRRVTKEKVMIRPDEGCQVNIELDEIGEVTLMPGLLFTDFE